MKEEGKALGRVRTVEVEREEDWKEEVEIEMVEVVGMGAEMAEAVAVAGG